MYYWIGERMTEKKEFAEVSKLDGPGKYRFAALCDWDIVGGVHRVSSDVIFGEHPTFEFDSIQYHLAKKFQNITSQVFYEASLEGGKYTPASFKFVPKWDGPLCADGDYLIYDGEICFIKSDGNCSGDNLYSNFEIHSNFEIKDVGNLSIEKNKLIVDEPIGRDVNLELMFNSAAPHHTEPPKHWRTWITLEGENPGKLVKEVIDYINSEKERLKAPLWKRKPTLTVKT